MKFIHSGWTHLLGAILYPATDTNVLDSKSWTGSVPTIYIQWKSLSSEQLLFSLKNTFLKKHESYLSVYRYEPIIALLKTYKIQCIIWECSSLGWTYALSSNCFLGFEIGLECHQYIQHTNPIFAMTVRLMPVMRMTCRVKVYDYKSQAPNTSKEMTGMKCLLTMLNKPEIDSKSLPNIWKSEIPWLHWIRLGWACFRFWWHKF